MKDAVTSSLGDKTCRIASSPLMTSGATMTPHQQKWGYFKFDCMDRYSLVLGMHPDEATDHIIMYAARNKVPFVVCPCCVKPDAAMYNGTRTFTPWIQHLLRLAQPTHTVEQFTLRMTGKNLVLVGRPKK